jgi:hypothetical protein
MGKITPTYADTLKELGGPAISPPLHIVAAHEPLSNGEGTQLTWLSSKADLKDPGCTHPEPLTIPIGVTAVPDAKPALKIALIGTAPSSRMLAPFGDLSWKIWGCSPGNMNVIPRADAWFEIHANLLWPEYESYGKPYIEWLKTLTIPVFMQDQSLVPNAVSFPWRELVDEFGQDFFTSSFAWMMAYAMKLGATEIGLFGIDMASRDEYILQRPGFYFFRHEAKRRGIKIVAPNESDIMQSPPLYAISDSTPFGRKLLAREQEIRQRVAAMTAERDKKAAEVQSMTSNITYLQGALEDVDYMKAIWSGLGAQVINTERNNG